MALRWSVQPVRSSAAVRQSRRDPYAFADGWRRGEVVAVMRDEEVPNPRFWTCLRSADHAVLGAERFVVVAYPSSVEELH